MKKRNQYLRALPVALAVAATVCATPVFAAGGGVHIDRQAWSFAGPFGRFDRDQLQRGFQVYQNVCAGCHSINRLRFRNLAEKGGPEFPEEVIKALAAEWPNQVLAGPNDDGEIVDEDGELLTRKPLLSDAIPGPYRNDKQAEVTNGGALPPDLSLIAKARTTEYTGPWWWHPIHMAKDIVTAYQEGGVDYLYALLTGYSDEAPAYRRTDDGKLVAVSDDEATGSGIERCVSVTHGHDGEKDVCSALQEGMNYNAAFPGHQIKMAAPLFDEAVEYKEGADGKPVAPTTKEQYARDVAAFLAWAADPSHDQRKRTGWLVMLYLLITTLVLYLAKKAIWKGAKH